MTSLPLIIAASLIVRPCNFQIKCEHQEHSVVIDFKSPSGDCTEDDMRATITAGHRSHVMALPANWYSPISHMLKTNAECRNGEGSLAGFFVDDSRLLIFVTSSGRPGYDNVVAALVNVKEKKLMHYLDLGKSKETSIPVLKTGKGFKLRIIREYLSDVNCDCSAATVDDWMEVRIFNDKLTASWMRPP